MASPVDLAPLRAALEDVDGWCKHGLYFVDENGAGVSVEYHSHDGETETIAATCEVDDFAPFVAGLLNAAPALRAALDELERLRALIDNVRKRRDIARRDYAMASDESDVLVTGHDLVDAVESLLAGVDRLRHVATSDDHDTSDLIEAVGALLTATEEP